MTIYADPEENAAKKKLTKVDAFVGESSLQHQIIRNGWVMAHHTTMAAWESIGRENERGIWRGELIPPAKWLKGERLPGEK